MTARVSSPSASARAARGRALAPARDAPGRSASARRPARCSRRPSDAGRAAAPGRRSPRRRARASCGSAGLKGSPASSMRPPSGDGAGEDLHQRALAGAVLTEQRVNLARPRAASVDAAERAGATERFVDRRDVEKRRVRRRSLIQPLAQIGLEQLLDLRLVHVAGVSTRVDRCRSAWRPSRP